MDNIRVIYIDMPTGMHGYVITKDDFHTIVLNSRDSAQQNRLSYYHELGHIQNGDYNKKTSVGIIEINAHGTLANRSEKDACESGVEARMKK